MKDYKEVIKASQDVLADYICSSSQMSERECIDKLLGILDDQELVKQMREE